MNDLNPFMTVVVTLIAVAAYGTSVAGWTAVFRNRSNNSDDAIFSGFVMGTFSWFFCGIFSLIGGNNEWWRVLMMLGLCFLAAPCYALGRWLTETWVWQCRRLLRRSAVNCEQLEEMPPRS